MRTGVDGRLVKTTFVLASLADEELRARIDRQLNKGEQLHALRGTVLDASEGHVRQRTPEQQSETRTAWRSSQSLTAWNTVYIQDVLDDLGAAGKLITTGAIVQSPRWSASTSTSTATTHQRGDPPRRPRLLRTPATATLPAPGR